jgi:hypothetical protein
MGRNPWMVLPALAAAKHVELPPRPPEGGPGPFAFADADAVRAMLGEAGWQSIAVESIEIELGIGDGLGLESTVDFLLQMGPAGAALREAGDDARAAAKETAIADLESFHRDGALRMPSAAWLFTATATG